MIGALCMSLIANNCTEAGKLGCVVVGDELCDVLTPGGRNSCYCDVERCQKEGDCCADATSGACLWTERVSEDRVQ